MCTHEHEQQPQRCYRIVPSSGLTGLFHLAIEISAKVEVFKPAVIVRGPPGAKIATGRTPNVEGLGLPVYDERRTLGGLQVVGLRDLAAIMGDTLHAIQKRLALRLLQPDARDTRQNHLVEMVEHGAGHRLSPSELNFRANIMGMKLLGVEYTGNRPQTLTTCQNKYHTKLLLEAHDLPTSPYFLVTEEPVPTDHDLVFPLIVKPALEDASGGIESSSVVQDQAELEARVVDLVQVRDVAR